MKYSTAALLLLLSETIPKISSLIINIYIARTFGKEGYGHIVLGFTILTYFMLISNMGLKTLGIIEASKIKTVGSNFISNIFTVRIVNGIATFILLALISFIWNDNISRLIILLFGLNLLIDAISINWYFQGKKAFKRIAIARILPSLIYPILVILLIKSIDDLYIYPLLFVAINFLSFLILYLNLRPFPFSFKIKEGLRNYPKIAKESIPIGVGSLFTQINTFLPPILIGKICGISMLGAYGASFKIVGILLLIDSVFGILFFSSIPSLWEQNKSDAKNKLEILTRIAIGFGALASFSISIFSDIIINLIYGEKYLESSYILKILVWFFGLTLINSVISFSSLTLGNRKRYLHFAFMAFILNIIIIPLLILTLSLEGALFSVLIGEMIFIIFFYYCFNKVHKISIYSALIKTAIITALLYYLQNIVTINPYMLKPLSVALFGILIIATRVVTIPDIKKVAMR